MERLKMTDAGYSALARTIKKVDLFAPLTMGQLEQVLPYVLLCSYKAGETVFKQGDPGDAFYIVYEGTVHVKAKKGFLSFSRIVQALGAGDFFGEMALLSKGPRSATVVCREPTKLFALMSVDFDFILGKNQTFAAEIRKAAERRKFDSAHGS